MAKRIEGRVQELLKEPYKAAEAERLKHELRGLRSARVDKRIRIIYRICEECRELGDGAYRPLDCCADPAAAHDRTVNILCLSDHYESIPWEFDF